MNAIKKNWSCYFGGGYQFSLNLLVDYLICITDQFIFIFIDYVSRLFMLFMLIEVCIVTTSSSIEYVVHLWYSRSFIIYLFPVLQSLTSACFLLIINDMNTIWGEQCCSYLFHLYPFVLVWELNNLTHN